MTDEYINGIVGQLSSTKLYKGIELSNYTNVVDVIRLKDISDIDIDNYYIRIDHDR